MRFFNVWLPSDNGQFRMTEGPHGVKHVLVSIRQIISFELWLSILKSLSVFWTRYRLHVHHTLLGIWHSLRPPMSQDSILSDASLLLRGKYTGLKQEQLQYDLISKNSAIVFVQRGSKFNPVDIRYVGTLLIVQLILLCSLPAIILCLLRMYREGIAYENYDGVCLFSNLLSLFPFGTTPPSLPGPP